MAAGGEPCMSLYERIVRGGTYTAHTRPCDLMSFITSSLSSGRAQSPWDHPRGGLGHGKAFPSWNPSRVGALPRRRTAGAKEAGVATAPAPKRTQLSQLTTRATPFYTTL
ncbi:hypothetical protein SKAU_G00050780 [Synaphobranchus kaupii]|uniref:Uncharacterized protein n=1 Tax=Synaphobranchus kaupii TaxID=118154 RepID=A0A9Q1G2Y1_SYNKA|nr:hypothetical protein SKAU_G00050780 [Synaphobranchus kaupii]